MPSELERAEAALAKAEAKLAPIDDDLEAAIANRERHYHADRELIQKIQAKRDPARIAVMDLQDKVADLRAAEGLQPPTIGKANRG